MVAVPVKITSHHVRHSARSQQPSIFLASHSSPDCYFDIKLTQSETTTFNGKPAQQLEFKLDFARPFDQAKRIRSAEVCIKVTSERAKSKRLPKIVGINPEASLVKIADHEITNGQSLGVTAGTPPTAPASAGVSANLSYNQKTSFAGNRLIHGFLKSHSEALWKMYEEPRSESGLPPSLSILMIVRSSRNFLVSAELCATRWSGWGSLGMVKSMYAPPLNESPTQFLITLGGRSSERAALKAKDNITAFLNENERKTEIKETIVNDLFEELSNSIPHVQYNPVLLLHSNIPDLLGPNRHDRQINVPFAPDFIPIGRSAKSKKSYSSRSDPLFNSPKLSVGHAKIWADKTGRIWIQDLGSTNGTYIQGRRLSPPRKASDPFEIRKYDTIEFTPPRTSRGIIGDDNDDTVLSTRVRFAGRPNLESRFLVRHLLRPATMRDQIKLLDEQERVVALANDIETKFEGWQSGTADEDQLAMLEQLHSIAHRKLREWFRVLCIPPMPWLRDVRLSEGMFGLDSTPLSPPRRSSRPFGVHFEDYDEEDSYSFDDDDDDYRARRRRSSYDRRRRSGDPPKHGMRSSGKSKADDVMFGNVAPTGEDALVKHQTVGNGWKEVRLSTRR